MYQMYLGKDLYIDIYFFLRLVDTINKSPIIYFRRVANLPFLPDSDLNFA